MSVISRREQFSRPNVTFGPFHFVKALPWLLLATAMRFVAFDGGPIALPATIIASISVLVAFVLVATRSIELTGGQTGLSSLTIVEQIKLARAILYRIALLMLLATTIVSLAGYRTFAPHMMLGLDGMAFDQFVVAGKFWSATVAALVLLMVIGADTNNGTIGFFSALEEFGRRFFWIAAAVVILGGIYIGLGLIQGAVRHAVLLYVRNSPHAQFLKNAVIVTFVFGFAMLRLWITLLVLTYGLKQSYREF